MHALSFVVKVFHVHPIVAVKKLTHEELFDSFSF